MTLYDEFPDKDTLLLNHENRILQLEHQVAVLEGRIPKNVRRRIAWWIVSLFPVIILYIGLLGAFLGPGHILGWALLILGFSLATSNIIIDVVFRHAAGPREHQSLIVKDHR